MSEFISLFYVIWWLQANVGATAPMNDLKAIQQMIMYRRYNDLVANTCLMSWFRHLWSLSEELVILCLADQTCPFRDDVASALTACPVSQIFSPGKPKIERSLDEDWPEDGSLPNLAEFVGERSHLLFSLFQFSEADMDWLKFPSSQWNMFTGYEKFLNIVQNLAVVNDAGERGVKAIQEVVGKTTKEALRQSMLLTTSEDRKKHPNRGKGKGTKEKLSKK